MLTCATTKENYILVSRDALSSRRDSNRAYLSSIFDWKSLRTTVHNVCKKCPICLKAKTTNQKYGKLTLKQDETNPWDTLCLDLIGPYKIPPLKLWCLTMINPATGWFEMKQIPNKMAAEIADITKKTWFTHYPLPQRIVFDRGTKFMDEFDKI